MTNLENLKITAFWRIVETNNVCELDVNYSIRNTYSDVQKSELQIHWSKLYDEFYELRVNKSGKYLMNKNYDLAKLSLTLELLSDIENRLILLISMDDKKSLNNFVINRTLEILKDFSRLFPKVRVNTFSSCSEILEVVQSVIKSQINIYDEKSGAKDKTVVKQKQTIFDVTAMMSKILGYSLDVNNMSCLEFIGHENMINSMKANEQKK